MAGAVGRGSAVQESVPSGVLRLLANDDAFEEGFIAGFMGRYPRLELVATPLENGDEASAKLQAGFPADVVNSCVDVNTVELVQGGLLRPIDTARIVNWEALFPAFKQLPGVSWEGRVYLIPVDAGTAGIMYNADEVAPPPDSWGDLFDPKYAGRAALEDLSVTAIDIGALAAGYRDPQELTPDQLEEVTEYLIEHNRQFRTIYYRAESSLHPLFASGEIVISSGYPGSALIMQRRGLNVRFVAPKEGQLLWACGYGISTNARNIEAAYAFLNYVTEVEPQLYATKRRLFMGSNSRILDYADEELIEAASLERLFDLDNAISPNPPGDRGSWEAAWARVKAAYR